MATRSAGVMLAATGACFLLFVGLGDYALWDPDEAKHALIARELFESGQWWAPTVNGEPYHHKPAFLYLLVGVAYSLFGVGEFAARLVPALACLATLVVVFTEASRRSIKSGDRSTVTGLVAAGLLLCAPFFPFVGRFTNFDSLVTLFLTATVFRVAAWLDVGKGKPLPLDAWALAALATLTKGPMVVALLLPPLLLFVVTGRIKAGELRLGRGLLLYVSLVGAWALPAALLNPEYIREFFVVHNIQRYIGAPGVSFHDQPIWFFLPVAFGCLLPWAVLVPPAMTRGFGGRDSCRWLALYSCWVFFFFSLSHGKLATYVMPAFPAAAVLVARWLEDNGSRPAAGAIGAALFTAAAVMVALGPASLWFIAEETGGAYQGPASLFFWLASAGGLLALFGWRRLYTVRRINAVLCCAMFLVVTVFAAALGPRISHYSSDADLAALVVGDVPAGVRLAAWGVRPWSFRFYCDRPLLLTSDAGDYEGLITAEEPLLLLSKASRLPSLGQRSVDELKAWRSNFRHTIYANRAAWALLEGE